MLRKSFNDHWICKKEPDDRRYSNREEYISYPVTLPHDAMIAEMRKEENPGGPEGGYYPGGNYTYTKKFFVPKELCGGAFFLEFEGVYRACLVHINDHFAGSCQNGYRCFCVDISPYLNYGEENLVCVTVYNGPQPSSRWYSGSGIYRPVSIMVGSTIHIEPYGLKISTPEVDQDSASVKTMLQVRNRTGVTRTVTIATELRDSAGNIAANSQCRMTLLPNSTDSLYQNVYIKKPKLWSLENPELYTCHISVYEKDQLLDTVQETFGIRTITVDPIHGLRLNGLPIKLRGACYHHDNGILGAATFARAEERRVEIGNKAGFNSIRVSHNPASRALLDACDRLGVLVLDELCDTWNSPKRAYDYAVNFADNWEKDVVSLVNKDYNHPSVFMYSIGNEIREVASAQGAVWNRLIANRIRELDNTRLVTNAINGLVALGHNIAQTALDMGLVDNQSVAADGDINDVMTGMLGRMNEISAHSIIGERIQESCDALDAVGYNYMRGRYEQDILAYPNRIIYGSETLAPDIDLNWELVKKHPQILGDYTWTGWDYIGEAGIGAVKYNEVSGFNAPWPCYLAYCGDMNLIGDRRPASYYREIIFGLRKEPYLAVQLPGRYADRKNLTPWGTAEAVSSWTWPGYEGKPCVVEVYSDAEEVELICNAKSLGRKTLDRRKAFFNVCYEPGSICAVSYRNGKIAETYSLKTASNNVHLLIESDKSVLRADGQDIAFLSISVVDDEGTIHTDAVQIVTMRVSGAGVLQGFGSGNPYSEENLCGDTHKTFEGRLLAAVRATEAGDISIEVISNGISNILTLTAE